MLKADHDTRQAVITIWDPAYDGYSDVRDTPCTVMFQFMIRDEQLHMSTYMRSNDVWWGLAYDLFQFTSLQVMMSEVLRIPAGEYHHHVGSLHVYERDLELVKQLEAKSPKVFVPPFNVELKHDGTWESIQARASSILSGNVDARFSDRELALHRALNR